MHILISDKKEVSLIDDKRIIEHQVFIQNKLVNEFIIDLTIRYCLPKELLVRDNMETITLDNYARLNYIQ